MSIIAAEAKTFFVGSHKQNYKAIRTYERVGFAKNREFLPTEGTFKASETVFIIKKRYEISSVWTFRSRFITPVRSYRVVFDELEKSFK